MEDSDSYAALNELFQTSSEVAIFQKDKLTELSTKEFPSSDSKNLIKILQVINFEIIKIFEELIESFHKLSKKSKDDGFNKDIEKDYQGLRNSLFEHQEFVWKVNEIINFVEQSAREHISQSTVYLVSELTEIYSKDSSFFLKPTTMHNFLYQDLGSYIEDIITDGISNPKTLIDSLPKNISILSFPEIYKDNIIGNVLLAHEIGHFIVNENNLTDEVFNYIEIDKDTFKDPTSQIQSQSVQGSKKQLKISEFLKNEEIESRLWDSWANVTQNWIVELLSDMIAFKLLGPVFVIALTEELLSILHHGQASNNHPPTSLRLEILLGEMEKEKFLEKITNYDDKKKIQEIINKIKNYIKTPSEEISNNPVWKEAFNAINSVKTTIISSADKTTKSMKQYNPEIFGENVPKLLRKLENLIPPCEIKDNTPADIASILNAGIIFKLTWRKNKEYSKSTREELEIAERTINSLVLRSIEMSIIQKQMLENMEIKS